MSGEDVDQMTNMDPPLITSHAVSDGQNCFKFLWSTLLTKYLSFQVVLST